ncbi:unnamed protein product [Sphagnum jensenii]|uniref:Uncharacterized protein n=1 Tax=Sphagnum jensenii TaxID=128206 RepID=A0ABP0VAW0_9BRYO
MKAQQQRKRSASKRGKETQMAYSLTLSKSERDAIDWVGFRYNHGDPFYKLLCKCTASPEDADWDDVRDITYDMPEHIAWEIRELFEEDNFEFACFAPEFVSKLMQFVDRIV